MRGYSLNHLSDASLRHDLSHLVTRERSATADVIAHIAEYQARRLYATDGFPNMTAYCMKVLGYSEDAAWRRSHAAATAHQYPILFSMLADGRLHLTAVCLLAPYLTAVNAGELLEAAVHRSRKEIESLVAERFPRADVPTRIAPVSETLPSLFEASQPASVSADSVDAATMEPCASAPARKNLTTPSPRVRALGPQRFALQVTIDEETHDLLRYAQDLLSHQVPGGQIATVLRRVLEAAIPVLEKTKFAATEKPRRSPGRPSRNRRHIPSSMKRAVWKRDGGQCTFVSDDGQRCGSRRFLEFDHEEPAALDGDPTVGNVRLRCHAHNQLEAERRFGSEFMRQRRERARARTRADRERKAGAHAGQPGGQEPATTQEPVTSDADGLDDVWLG